MTLVTSKTRLRANTQAVATTQTMPAPTRGLNYRDPLVSMQPGDALRLDNFLCSPGYAEVRKGWQPMVTGFAAPVESLLPYTALNGTSRLFAVAGGAFYDVTAPGVVGAAVVSGLSNSYWYSTQLTNSAGTFLVACNGIDPAKLYNGTAWADLAVTGISPSAIRHCTMWKHRLWMVEKNTAKAWYLAEDAISGAAVPFPITTVWKRGGSLQAILTWTVDGGAGADDYLLFVSTMGEVAVYQGTNPASPATFGLVGTYYIGKPIGERFYAQYGGDVLMLTEAGLVPFSKYLQSTTVDKTSFLTDRILQLINEETSNFGSVQGWEVHVYLDANFVLVQVPGGPFGQRYQYVMSLLTGGWSKFLEAPAICWMVQGSMLYHGQETKVVDAWVGGLDEAAGIQFTMIPAFSAFGKPTVQKHFTMGRLTIQSDQAPNYVTKFLKDYDPSFVIPSLPSIAPSGTVWDAAVWDVSTWGGSANMHRNWYSLNGIGYVGSQVVQGVSVGQIFRIIAADYVFQSGGLL